MIIRCQVNEATTLGALGQEEVGHKFDSALGHGYRKAKDYEELPPVVKVVAVKPEVCYIIVRP